MARGGTLILAFMYTINRYVYAKDGSNIIIHLKEGDNMALITGRILSHDGKVPKQGVLVAIITGTSPHPDIATKSDESGCYVLSGLQAGTYVVRADNTQSAIEIEADDAEVSCDLLLEVKVKTKSKRPATRSSRKERNSTIKDHTYADSEPNEYSDKVSMVSSSAVEKLPHVESITMDDEGDVEEIFESDPYDRDVDPVETVENAPVSITLVERGLVYAALSIDIARGVKDVDALTDKAWRTLNPTEDFPISTGDPDYARKSAEWLLLHRDIVVPLVAETEPRSPQSPTSAGPLGIVSVRMPNGPTHRLSANRLKFGLQETIDALTAIAAEWHRRHPNVVLMIRDISREGGGNLQPPHKSHRCGCEADCQLWVGKTKVCMKHPRYPEWRPLMQELVEVVRSNNILPVKVIGFSDREIKNVSHWSGHTCHAHVRFCAPTSKIDEIESFIEEEYADKPRRNRPNYRC